MAAHVLQPAAVPLCLASESHRDSQPRRQPRGQHGQDAVRRETGESDGHPTQRLQRRPTSRPQEVCLITDGILVLGVGSRSPCFGCFYYKIIFFLLRPFLTYPLFVSPPPPPPFFSSPFSLCFILFLSQDVSQLGELRAGFLHGDGSTHSHPQLPQQPVLLQ